MPERSPETQTRSVQEAKNAALQYAELSKKTPTATEELAALEKEMAPKYTRAELSKLANEIDPTQQHQTMPERYELVPNL